MAVLTTVSVSVSFTSSSALLSLSSSLLSDLSDYVSLRSQDVESSADFEINVELVTGEKITQGSTT